MKGLKTIKLLLFISIISLSCFVASQSLADEYLVKRGDTLFKIATKYNVSVQELMNVNGLKSDLILVGQTLLIPESSGVVVESEPPIMDEKTSLKVTEDPTSKSSESVQDEATSKMVTEELQAKKEISSEKPVASIEDTMKTPGALDFKWAFITRQDPSGRNKVINISEMVSNPGSEKPVVSSGDKLSFFVEPGDNTYVYIYLLDSRNNLELIFPSSMDNDILKTELASGKKTYVPAKYEWFTFDDNTGTETFYLIASSDRLEKLEELTRQYYSGQGDKSDIKQKILNEIQGQKKLVAFRNPIEQPISFGGRIRGLEIDIAKLAVEVKGKDLYTKTIRLKHE